MSSTLSRDRHIIQRAIHSVRDIGRGHPDSTDAVARSWERALHAYYRESKRKGLEFSRPLLADLERSLDGLAESHPRAAAPLFLKLASVVDRLGVWDRAALHYQRSVALGLSPDSHLGANQWGALSAFAAALSFQEQGAPELAFVYLRHSADFFESAGQLPEAIVATRSAIEQGQSYLLTLRDADPTFNVFLSSWETARLDLKDLQRRHYLDLESS